MAGSRKLFSLLLLAVFLVACSGQSKPTSTPSPSNTTTPSSSTPSTPSSPAPAAPAKPKDLGSVKIVQSVAALSFAPTYVAQAKNYFKEEGVDATVTVVAGGAEANAALIGKSAQFAVIDSGAVPQLVEKGADVVSVQSNVGNLTMNLIIKKDVAEKHGLSRDLPLKERMAKLKGLTLGITGPGAATDIYTRWYVTQGGLVPEKDVKIVALGGGAALRAALQKGQIDGFQLSPPTTDALVADGTAIMLISASQGDVPELKFPYEVMVVRRDYMEANKDVVRAVARALSRANNFLLQNPAESTKLLQTYFPKVDPKVLDAAVKNILPAVPKDGLQDKEGWDKLALTLKQAGRLKKDFDSTEGKYWTNEFVKDLNGLADKK